MKNTILLWLLALAPLGPVLADDLDLPTSPIFVEGQVAPLVMLVMGRDHTLYYEAYNDATDLDGNGAIDEDETRYAPTVRDYYGYFDSYKCYSYDSSGVFVPTGTTDDKTCNGNGGTGRWSGDFLNYLTTSRIDALRKVLYGGYRGSDNQEHPTLVRSLIPQDAHTWGKTWDPAVMNTSTAGNLLVSSYAPLSDSKVYFFANTSLSYSGSPLLRVLETVQNPSPALYIWNWVSKENPVSGDYMDNYVGTINSARTDYVVRVQVCTDGMLESNCKKYTDSNSDNSYKPVGLLQNYGEGDDPKMEFGLITGSFSKNLSGGVLRAKVGKLDDEIKSNGQFQTRGSTGAGVIDTLNKLRITGFNFSSLNYNSNCGWITDGPLTQGKCVDWGNPIGEMLFESLRYFAGASSPTSDFSVSSESFGSGSTAFTLKQDSWDDPYDSHDYCAKPINLVISDTGVSYDSDQIPGSAFNSYSDSTLSSLDVSDWTATISEKEGLNNGLFYIGEVLGQTEGKNAPTAKTIPSLDQIRGLSPEEPTKMGSFYSAGLAYYGHETDLRSDINGDQKTNTIVVALASKLPQIKIKAGDNTITLIPYAKSVGGGISNAEGDFQPTDGIVDFYVESLSDTEGTFRVNYEDVEQGADHDMDFIVKYHYVVNADTTVTVTVTAEYASGTYIQHAGYVISGTQGGDGLYLDIDDSSVDTISSTKNMYYLDTPDPSSNIARKNLSSSNSYKSAYLPASRTRTFTASSSSTAASLLPSPLWYAAKWGGFNDEDSDGLPGEGEWDANSSGTPDNYFLVTNASDLESQLEEAFNKASEDTRSASAVSYSGYQLSNDSQAFLASFEAKNWSGDLESYAITDGTLATSPSWSAAKQLDARSSVSNRVIITWDGTDDGRALFTAPTSLDGATNGLSSDMIDDLLTGITGSTANKLSYVQALVDYLRGDQTDEAGDVQVPIIKTYFRPRSSRLGDIIHSTPVYGTSTDDVPFVIVGANDGMVHVFNADDGEEILAFIPRGVYDKLNQLADVDYDSTHQFYVDGEIKVSSITDDEGDKRVIAVGTFGLGAKGAWALDLSNLSSVSNSISAADKILWEVDSLGYVPYPPAIAKVQDGDDKRWVAAFGNGYNDGTDDGYSSLKVYDLLTGTLLKTLTTTQGRDEDPDGDSRPNGMAEPVFADADLDGVADRLYAGDLFGYLWKVDVDQDNIDDWDFAIKSGSTPLPLFITQYATGSSPAYERQPITTRPAVAFHSTSGLMVLVGTGKYLEASDTDVSDQVTQSLYGLWDNSASETISRTNLVKQEITAQSTTRTLSSNSIDWSTKKGWYLDLINPNTDSNEGERIVNNITVRSTKAYLTTLIPDEDPCAGGGTGWYMEINLLTGDNQGLVDNSALLERIPSKAVTKLVTTASGDVSVSNSVRLDGQDELFESNPTVERTGAVSWLKVY
ncbi:PilC/PilY family type IV pilus protein [Pseudaeromonas sp. ZJS20]|uniref:pilus assembly protein n=1 Tax=Pseudaeromonas aegiceratis TaxID=3153928 RepID=UPI00390C6666